MGLYVPATGWAVGSPGSPSSSPEMLYIKFCAIPPHRLSITQYRLSYWTQIYLQSTLISFFNSGFPAQFNEGGCAPYVAQRDSGHSRRFRACLNFGSNLSELPITMRFQAASLICGASENSTAWMRKVKIGWFCKPPFLWRYFVGICTEARVSNLCISYALFSLTIIEKRLKSSETVIVICAVWKRWFILGCWLKL